MNIFLKLLFTCGLFYGKAEPFYLIFSVNRKMHELHCYFRIALGKRQLLLKKTKKADVSEKRIDEVP